MANKKSTTLYYFSVEGQTEKWYLQWLENLINNTESSVKKVSFKCEVEKRPTKYVKKLNVLEETTIYHLFDYESNDEEHTKLFLGTLDELKKASTLKGVKYCSGYSNFTFDLWIILHMTDAFSSLSDRKQYLKLINRCFDENFESMDEYKKEANFKRCLSKMDLSNVLSAIERSKKIMEANKRNGYTYHKYNNYYYYKENPSLLVWEAVEKILIDCKLS